MKKKIIIAMLFCAAAVSAKTISLYLENDFAFETDSDYTHGTEITYMQNEPYWLFDDVGIGVMQMMYAPDDIKQTEIIEDDRPYAGLLAINLIGKAFKKYHTDEIQLSIGVLGEYSYASDTQKLIHKMIDCAEPQGWDNQLNNEMIVNAEYRRTYSWQTKLTDWLFFDVQPGADLQVGNWNNSLEVFSDFRLGDFDTKPINHGITQRDIGLKGFKHWIFIGVAGKNVWYATQLDGNVCSTPTHHVESENLVGEFRYGFGLGYQQFDIQIMNVLRTKEYTIQDQAPKFSVLIANWKF